MKFPEDHVSTHDPVKYRKERRAKRIEQGLCTRCDSPAAMGHTDCASCMAAQKAKIDGYRQERAKRGLCIQCGKVARPDVLRCQKCTDRLHARGKDFQRAKKASAMKQYGKNGEAVCCWDGCLIDDLDMLTLDHIANNGAAHRREYTKSGRGGGTVLYRMLERQGYPPGYQTLCCNHNLKKHLLEVRNKRSHLWAHSLIW